MAVEVRRLLAPESVAVIGATETRGKPGRIVCEQLLQTEIRVFPVNPKSATVLGRKCYTSVDAIGEPIDVAVVAISASAAVAAVSGCVAVGVPFVIVLAGGFGEAGPEGREIEEKLREVVSGSGTRVLGPNTLGVQVPASGFDTVFVEHARGELDPAGRAAAALISQSGSVAVEALGGAAVHGLPLAYFVGLGNAIDLQSGEFVSHAANAADVSALALYLEHLGEGRALLRAARRVAVQKPVFFLKAGRTSAGAAAVASHTGRLAGSDRVVDAALAQHGIQRVADDEELIDALRAVGFARVPAGNRVAIVTPAGGYGVMGADYIESSRGELELAVLSGQTEQRLREVILPFASSHNPVDLTAGADTAGFLAATEAVLDDVAVDIVIAFAFFAPAAITDELIDGLAELANGSEKCLIVFSHAGTRTDDYCRRFTAAGVAAYPSLIRAIRAASILAARRSIVSQAASVGEPGSAGQEASSARYATAGAPAIAAQPTEADAKALLDAYGVATPHRLVIGPGEPAQQPAFDGPFAVKAAAAGLLHKTEANAVRLGVEATDLNAVVDELRGRFAEATVIVEQMVADIQVELIVGAVRDPDLGHALMLGAGGFFTELYRDVTFRLLPATRGELMAMTHELDASALLDGFRGVNADRESLVDALLRISAMVEAIGESLSELDINPLCFSQGRWVALDAKLTLKETSHE